MYNRPGDLHLFCCWQSIFLVADKNLVASACLERFITSNRVYAVAVTWATYNEWNIGNRAKNDPWRTRIVLNLAGNKDSVKANAKSLLESGSAQS